MSLFAHSLTFLNSIKNIIGVTADGFYIGVYMPDHTFGG